METGTSIGYELKSLDNLIGRKMDHSMRNSEMMNNVTRMHAGIIGFLFRTQNRDVFQRDVEAEFSITRSTATSILKLMVKKGYIIRIPVAYDDRLKKLVLTEEGLRIQATVMKNIEATEKSLADSITAEEFSEFMRIIQKLKASLETS